MKEAKIMLFFPPILTNEWMERFRPCCPINLEHLEPVIFNVYGSCITINFVIHFITIHLSEKGA